MNPYATVGMPEPPAAPQQAAAHGDWLLPLVVLVLGLAGVRRMMRRMLE